MSDITKDNEQKVKDTNLEVTKVDEENVYLTLDKCTNDDHAKEALSSPISLDKKVDNSDFNPKTQLDGEKAKNEKEVRVTQETSKERSSIEKTESNDTSKRKFPNITDNIHVNVRSKRQRRYLNHREEKIEKQREYYTKNRERMVEKQADYYKANRQEVIARQNEYYQKNKSRITEKKRQWYQEKRGFVSNKRVVHPSLVDSISLEDSTKEGCGNVKIKQLKPIIQKFNNDTNKKWKVVYDIRPNPDFISNCSPADPQLLTPGKSKLHSLSDNENIMTLPPGYSYRNKPLATSELLQVDSFLALAVSQDEESLDLRYLLHKDQITLEGMRNLLHAIQSVLDVDIYDFLTEKQSLFFINPTCLSNPVLKNRFSKQIMRLGNEKPEPPKPLCIQRCSFETKFISAKEMEEDIPHHQLLLNHRLAACDTGAVAVQIRKPNSTDFQIVPLFSVNMEAHWRYYLKPFASILINWFGNHTLLNAVFHELPCVITARNKYIQEMKEDCFDVMQQAKEIAVCEHCGQTFEFNRYLTSENKKYQAHVESHKRQCKFCGETFPSGAARRYHERTHRENFFKCKVETCTYVGRSQQAVDTHVRFKHKKEICEQCGKEFQNIQCLNLHREVYHLPKTPNSFYCEICGRAYRTKNERDKHVVRHNRDNCLMDRWMHEDPKLYKYECTKHTDCKKYFKKAYSLRKHLKRMGGKDYPTNISRFFRPEIPPDQETIKDYELPPTPPPRTVKDNEVSEEAETRKRKKKVFKKKDTTDFDAAAEGGASSSSVIVNTTIVQAAVTASDKSEVVSTQLVSEDTKQPVAAKRGRKKKAQNITIVQVSSDQTSTSSGVSHTTSPIITTTKELTPQRPTIVTAYAPTHLQGQIGTPTNTIIVHTDNVKVEMDNPIQVQPNLLAVGTVPALNTTATVIPIQHTNQLFHQIHVQQQPNQLQPPQQVVPQHVTTTSSQPITEHVWVSGHQVFYNTR